MNGRHHNWRRLGAWTPSEVCFSYKRDPPQWGLHLRSLCACAPDCMRVARIRWRYSATGQVLRFCKRCSRENERLGYERVRPGQ